MLFHYFCIYYIILLLTLNTSCDNNLSISVVKRYFDGSDFNFNIIASYTGTTPMQCARNCYSLPLCMSFGYHDNGYCNLYSASFSTTFSGFKDGTWKMFDVFTSTCPFSLDYVYNRDLNLCYKYYSAGTANNYTAANQTCYDDGGYLIRITSQVIHSYIVSFMDTLGIVRSTYIGGSRENVYSNWTYDGQTAMTYFNWDVWQNMANDKQYIKLRQQQWELAGGGSDRPFICQINIS